MGEVGHAVSRQKLSLNEANSLIMRLHQKYGHVFQQAGGNPGVAFDQAYDLQTLTPLPAWERMYQEVKSEIRNMGLAAL
jgi:methylamine--corrinoid protein Co-methyltransferase